MSVASWFDLLLGCCASFSTSEYQGCLVFPSGAVTVSVSSSARQSRKLRCSLAIEEKMSRLGSNSTAPSAATLSKNASTVSSTGPMSYIDQSFSFEPEPQSQRSGIDSREAVPKEILQNI
eukprot:2646330-Prymnesium_polylepis.1